MQQKWVMNSAGFTLTGILAMIEEERRRIFNQKGERRLKEDGSSTSDSSVSSDSWLVKFRRVVLGLDNFKHLPGGRVVGLACRQLPIFTVNDKDGSSASSSATNFFEFSHAMKNKNNSDRDQLQQCKSKKGEKNQIQNQTTTNNKNSDHVTQPLDGIDWIIDKTSTNTTPHAVMDQALIGPGFALYYSTGPVEDKPPIKSGEKADDDDDDDSTKESKDKQTISKNALCNDRVLSMTLGYVGWDDARKENNSIHTHASEILDVVVDMLMREADDDDGEEEEEEDGDDKAIKETKKKK
jgi:hypothetical protein